ncbi:MAG TPA: hypothetical protein PLV55_06010 [Anaerohalosphaeraceae bacterium]|nr:hypothetical protein [Anaerohalosphaeraceae bacterium]
MIPTCVIPQNLSITASPTFAGLKLTGLQASQAVMTDANKNLVSADYLDQPVKTTSSPYFAAIKFSTTNGDYDLTTCSLQSGFSIVPSENKPNIFRLYSKKGDNTQAVGIHFIPYGTISSASNSERLFFGWAPAVSRYVMHTFYNGSGTSLRSLALGVDTNNATTVQLFLHTNGNVGIQTSSPSSTLDVNGDIKCTSITPADGDSGTFYDYSGRIIEVQNGIITYIESP